MSMLNILKRVLLLIGVICLSTPIWGQKLITYEAGMGSRDRQNPDVWILYQRVRAQHEGMVLYADSALLNTVQNDFTAYRRIKIILTDTTSITGSELYYDGNARVVHMWGDTVVFKDGKTILKTDNLTYDRNTSTATYTCWGHAVNGTSTLDSRQGYYHSDTKEFFIYDDVVLRDDSTYLITDTLLYNTNSHLARFVSPTHIYSDSTEVYSEHGSYNTSSKRAVSTRASEVRNGATTLTGDSLIFVNSSSRGWAYGDVRIADTVNHITCTGMFGFTDQEERTSLITSGALVVFVDKGDTLWLHADTVWMRNSKDNDLEAFRAWNHAKLYRRDAQGMCDSASYTAADSLMRLYGCPVLWQDSYQCTADTIIIAHNGDKMRRADLRSSAMAVEQVDPQKYNQVKGANGVVYFAKGEPDYADILGSAQMVYYITEDDGYGRQLLVGVNVGRGADMRIYFERRQPKRVVTYGEPDMMTYPLEQLPADKTRLPGFEWYDSHRPKEPSDVFVW